LVDNGNFNIPMATMGLHSSGFGHGVLLCPSHDSGCRRVTD
jgi:hypothetical protein